MSAERTYPVRTRFSLLDYRLMTVLRLSALAVIAALTLATTAAWADTKDDVAAAVKKLGDATNYTFTSTVENQGGFATGPQVTKGQVEKDGYATLSVPLFSFGGDAPPPLDVAKKGDRIVVSATCGHFYTGNFQMGFRKVRDHWEYHQLHATEIFIGE